MSFLSWYNFFESDRMLEKIEQISKEMNEMSKQMNEMSKQLNEMSGKIEELQKQKFQHNFNVRYFLKKLNK